MSRSSGPSPRCRALLREVSAYLNGDLSPGRCRAIQRHLESCRSCAATTGRLRKTIEACRAARAQPLPRDVRARAKARIRGLLLQSARGAHDAQSARGAPGAQRAPAPRASSPKS